MENTKKPIDFLPDFSQNYVGELFHERGFAGGGARNYEIPGQAGTRAKREPRPEGVNDGK